MTQLETLIRSPEGWGVRTWGMNRDLSEDHLCQVTQSESQETLMGGEVRIRGVD